MYHMAQKFDEQIKLENFWQAKFWWGDNFMRICHYFSHQNFCMRGLKAPTVLHFIKLQRTEQNRTEQATGKWKTVWTISMVQAIKQITEVNSYVEVQDEKLA